MKRVTISQRWTAWTRTEPGWAYSALGAMATAFAALILHLGSPSGGVRQAALWAMIVCAVACWGILWARRQWWWFTFWTAVIVAVIVWEVASVLWGTKL